MPLPITPEELDQLDPSAQRELAALSAALSRSPKTRKGFLKLWRELDPERDFPELEASSEASRVEEEVNKRLEAFAAQQAEKEQAAERERLERSYTDMKTRLKVTPEEEKAAEELMASRHIGDFEFAVEHIRMKSAPPAAPASEGLNGALTIPNLEALAKDPFGWAPSEAHKAIDEILASRAA